MYPGQHAAYLANVSDGTAQNYTWNIEGPIIKEYDDDVYRSNALTASANLEEPIYMSPDDFRQIGIQFYWDNSTDTNRTITLTVRTTDGMSCQDSQAVTVERDFDNIDLQAEDFYVEANHRTGLGNDTRVLKQHENWHQNYSNSQPSYIDNGDLFFDFHKNYIAHFNLWRNTFGYDNIKAWNPEFQPERGIDINHVNRDPINETHPYEPHPLPSWFKHQRGGEGNETRDVTTYDMIRSPAGLQWAGLKPELLQELGLDELNEEYFRQIGIEGRANLIGVPISCEIFDSPLASSQYPRNQNALIDFEADQDLLGCALTTPYHNMAHGRISGDMSSPTSAPKDPIFWRLHKFIDNVSVNRFTPQTVPSEAMFIAPPLPVDLAPPRVYSQNPFRLNPYITELPTISEKEKDLFGLTGIPAISAEFNEPVRGVTAKDFLVNGSPASKVNGSGAGPYVFVGFKTPDIGPINVTFSSTNITDFNGNRFEGDSWSYVIIDSNADNDQDGVKDELEANSLLTSPSNPDTDMDTISDGQEATNLCLDPLDRDDHVMNMSGIVVNKTGKDSDNDGVTNVQESNQGTDPCQPPEESKSLHLEDTSVQGILPPLQVGTEGRQPFAVILKTMGGANEINNILSYNSFTDEAISAVNDNGTRRQISNAEEEAAIRTLNMSGFFDLPTAFYTPNSNDTEHVQFTVFAVLGDDIQVAHWTDASNGVPESILNLPYALTNILGTGSEFKADIIASDLT
jgi:hypothetical protein